MSLYSIILVLPIFFVLYAVIGLLLDTRKRTVPFGQKRSDSFFRAIQEFASAVGGSSINQIFLKRGGFRQRLDELLMRSGYPLGWKAADLLFIKEFLVVIAAVIVWQTNPSDPLSWALALAMGFFLPDIVLKMRSTARQTSMQRALPGFVDLVALAVESGLDLVVSVERITEKMVPSALKEELQAFLQESRLGAARREILKRWAFRTGLADAQSLSSLIIQSEEMGTPLANVLRSYAEDMRNRRILRAEEIAGKIPVKILFPMMVFFFPIVFVIILGPMAVQFLKDYK
jgi:tight adherence protein C